MNNFELHKRAQQMADSNSGYRLAKRNLMLEREVEELRREVGKSQQAQVEPVAWRYKGGGKFLEEPPHPESVNLFQPLYAHPHAPAAVPEGYAEARRVLQELVDTGHIEDEQSLRDAKAALAAAPAPAEPDSEG